MTTAVCGLCGAVPPALMDTCDDCYLTESHVGEALRTAIEHGRLDLADNILADRVVDAIARASGMPAVIMHEPRVVNFLQMSLAFRRWFLNARVRQDHIRAASLGPSPSLRRNRMSRGLCPEHDCSVVVGELDAGALTVRCPLDTCSHRMEIPRLWAPWVERDYQLHGV